jgi:hypothetical protein
VRIALLAGFALLALALGIVLTSDPLVAARSSVVSDSTEVVNTAEPIRICQGGELIPAGTAAVRIVMSIASVGPRLGVQVLAGGRVLSEGSKDAGWRGEGVTVPIERVHREQAHATVCLSTGRHGEILSVYGQGESGARSAVSAGHRLSAKVKLEYLRPSGHSWLSALVPIARRLGLGRASAGTWIALAILLGMGVSMTLAVWLMVRELPDRA